MTTTSAAQGDPAPALLLGPVLETLPLDLLQREVLRRLGPAALACFAQASHGFAAAVASTVLMQWAKHAKLAPRVHSGYYLPPLCLKEACAHAARCGNREVLEWLHNNGCSWDAMTACAAAAGGHLEVLQYTREHVCACRPVWALARVAVGAGAPLPVERGDAGIGRGGRAPGGVAVGAGERRDRRGLGQRPRACPRRWAKMAGGADVAGWTHCSVT